MNYAHHAPAVPASRAHCMALALVVLLELGRIERLVAEAVQRCEAAA